ncbi:MAG: P-II family nitrogen regulator [Deltaproteobacteria bacterium]|jgi:nitrogen regulatory protein PII 2|nr:P-II family nitrogen regulator [Deltaproteobacteria bacterium]
MKEVLAVLRSTKVNHTKNALTAAGFLGFTCVSCLGRGKKLVDPNLLKLILESGNLPMTAAGEAMTEATRLIPKRIFSIIVPDGRVKDVVDVIIAVNQTQNPGDGKIFVTPVLESYSVRIGGEADVV